MVEYFTKGGTIMGAQMNIKNAEARALAEKIAKAQGVSITKVVVEALRVAEKALITDDHKIKIAQFMAESRRLNAGRKRDDDPTAFLYDERGLPK
jgi:hypothetical protein